MYKVESVKESWKKDKGAMNCPLKNLLSEVQANDQILIALSIS